jgi:tetratricopeptide (TPR) repeat protein
MSDAQSALERGDWPAAREALGRAASLQPGSAAVADARGRLEEAERTAALARQRELARGFEAKEDWRRALAEYESALKLDGTVAFALEGRDRTARRAELAEKLAYHIAHPLRLATDAVAHEAERLLQRAREIDPAGPRHLEQMAELERALQEVRTPVAVVLESDGQTEVVVHKVGRLGAFDRKTLELRPGTYTVVGTRSGYRDVRRQLVVKPNAAPPSLVVRCEEAI